MSDFPDLRRFLAPQIADAVVSAGGDSILASHRRQVAVLFCDLRGYTNFADSVEPEELMGVLGEFHEVIGRLVTRFDATVGFTVGGESFLAELRGGAMPVRRAQPAESADAWLSAEEPLPLLRVVYGKQPLAEALRAGAVTLAGDRAVAERFLALFSLPAKIG